VGSAGWVRSRFLGVSKKTWMRSSINPSVRAVTVVGTMTAICIAGAQAILFGRAFETGVAGCAGLPRLSGCHCEQQYISFARPVTISEKRHQVLDKMKGKALKETGTKAIKLDLG
jgi:hypothetical protein